MDQQQIKRNIHRASLLMMASVILSRLIGFVREWAIAHTVGASAMTDVYYASFTIPDFLNYLMAAGALSITFIPVFSQVLQTHGKEIAHRLYRTLLTTMGSVLLLLVIVAEIFAPTLARVIAPGFSTEQIDLLAALLRVILPAQLFFYFGGLAMAVQQAHGEFKFVALAPLFYNSGIILCGVLLHQRWGVAGFSVGVLAGAVFSHGLLQWWGTWRLGFGARPLIDLSPPIRQAIARYLWLTFPLMLGFSLVATDEWISKYFASQLQDRAISWLAYARTEMRIPIAVIGQAAGVASFPFMARLWASGAYQDYGNTLLRELMKLWAAAPLAAIVLFQFAEPLTHFIYGGGQFTAADIVATAAALRLFSLGVFFWTAQVVLSRAFYACQKTWLPSLLGGMCSLAALPLYAWLGGRMGYEGLALAASVAIALYCLLLWAVLQKHLRKHCPDLDKGAFYRFVLIWSIVVAALGLVAHGLGTLGIYQHTRLSAFAELAVVATVLGGLALALLRTVFRKLTDGPLY